MTAFPYEQSFTRFSEFVADKDNVFFPFYADIEDENDDCYYIALTFDDVDINLYLHGVDDEVLIENYYDRELMEDESFRRQVFAHYIAQIKIDLATREKEVLKEISRNKDELLKFGI